MNLSFLWNLTPTGILIDSNNDGAVDGVVACLVPLTPAQWTPHLWAAAANLAARIGLESPALRLPLAVDIDAVESWQIPILLTIGDTAVAVDRAPWSTLLPHLPIFAQDDVEIAWLEGDAHRALRIHAADAAALASVLNRLATAHDESPPAQSPLPAQEQTDLDLARLFGCAPDGLFLTAQDGSSCADNRFHLILGPQTDVVTGMAAVNLAARLGLETSGLTLPLAFAADTTSAPDVVDDYFLLLGFGEANGSLSPKGRQILLDPVSAHYLAEVYPHLDSLSQRHDESTRTLSAIVATVDDLVHARSPQMWLALAEVQAGQSIPVSDVDDLCCEAFRLTWNPADQLDHVGRLRRILARKIRPKLKKQATPTQITVFCSAPRPARDDLATEIAEMAGHGVHVQVLPVHKAGLAWLLEDQIPQLIDRNVARVALRFAAFRSPDPNALWLDLPHRWLQEIFPADELLARHLHLDLSQVEIEMFEPDATEPTRVYELIAYNANGDIVHRGALPLLWDEHLYLTDMHDYGLVHPSAGGIIVTWPGDHSDVWPVSTDEALFWAFYQQCVLPSIRSHVLAVSRGRPISEWEPYFESLQVEAYFGWPDEPLGVSQEFVSVGEALHEDIYFNTLDYLVGLGEAFCGQRITAAGQVMPLIHDFYNADGARIAPSAPRAVVTLRAWAMPRYLPPLDLVVGHRSDMPKPQHLSVSSLTLNETGDAIQSVTLRAHYINGASARLAARTLARRVALAPLHFASNVAVQVLCVAATTEECVDLGLSSVGPQPRPPEPPHDPKSDVIGPRQLEAELADVARLPGVSVWQIGRSYQGRPGYAVDVIAPLHSGQTHHSRRKLGQQKPTAFLIARHHANEVSSTTAVLNLTRSLANDPTQRDLLARVNVVVLPIANPDGAAFHYQLMTEHPHWKHHAARFNAAGKEFGQDTFNASTLFGEAKFRRAIWSAWLPDAIVDNHGVPSHEWCQPYAGYNSPPRFVVSYHMVQAMLYGIISFVEGAETAASALREAVSKAVMQIPWLRERNEYWLNRYHTYGHRWSPETFPLQTHNQMLFFYRGYPAHHHNAQRTFAGRYPSITQFEWVTEVPDETAQGDYLAECAIAQTTADVAMLRLLAESAQPMQRQIHVHEDGRTTIRFQRNRQIGA
ncbi:hypothetical protein GC175_21010 [bacterium]|nr:hypothetical protein [bacterium]